MNPDQWFMLIALNSFFSIILFPTFFLLTVRACVEYVTSGYEKSFGLAWILIILTLLTGANGLYWIPRLVEMWQALPQ